MADWSYIPRQFLFGCDFCDVTPSCAASSGFVLVSVWWLFEYEATQKDIMWLNGACYVSWTRLRLLDASMTPRSLPWMPGEQL